MGTVVGAVEEWQYPSRGYAKPTEIATIPIGKCPEKS
jgi:hypothetical protein